MLSYFSILLNRMVHAFTSAGLTLTQYESLGQAANIGHMNEHYVSQGKFTDQILRVLFCVKSIRFAKFFIHYHQHTYTVMPYLCFQYTRI